MSSRVFASQVLAMRSADSHRRPESFFVISTVHQLCDGKRRRGQCFRAGRRAGYGVSGSVALNRWDELVATRCLLGRRWGWLLPVGGVCQASRAEIVGPVRPDADREKNPPGLRPAG